MTRDDINYLAMSDTYQARARKLRAEWFASLFRRKAR